jgi:hypothetical protein
MSLKLEIDLATQFFPATVTLSGIVLSSIVAWLAAITWRLR